MRKVVRHAIFWGTIYFLWAYMKTGGYHYYRYLIVNLLNVPLYMAAFYMLKHIQIPHLLNKDKKIAFVTSIIISTMVLYTVWRTAGVLWLDELRGIKGRIRFMSLGDYLIQSVQFYSPAMALWAYESHIERRQEVERIHQLEKEKMATELKYLKAQLNPHFLFNTLNNLYSYVVNQSPKAPDMILRLSSILDYVLYKSQKEAVPLNEEVDLIEDFLELEQIRYGDRLQVDYSADEHMLLPISPLLLLSLVENAFKHGASGDIDSPRIRIEIKEEKRTISCKVWNTKSKHNGELNDAYKEGIGLSNIKRQLNLIYPDCHQLIIDDQEQTFNVSLVINTES